MPTERRYDAPNKWQNWALDALRGINFERNVPGSDAYGRKRVSEPFTQFDSKLLGDERALFWDNQETGGSGTDSTYSADRSSVTLSVSDSTTGTRVLQSFERFNYQPGKSQVLIMSNVAGAASSGITKRWGYFDASNGVFF